MSCSVLKSPFGWIAALAIVAGGSTPTLADFILPTTGTYGWDRPTAPGGNATFQAWDVFTTPAGANAPTTVFGAGSDGTGVPLPDGTGNPAQISAGSINTFRGFGGDSSKTWAPANAGGTANVVDTSAATNGSFVTGSGNIYSPTGSVTPLIAIPNNIDGVAGNQTSGLTTILLQTRTQGSLIDLSTVKLFDPVSGQFISPSDSLLLATQNLGGFGGILEDRLFEFNVAGNADSYQLSFAPTASSMSLDRVAVDTFYDPSGSLAAVPEPASMVLTGLFLGGAWVGHRIRRRRSAASEEPGETTPA